MKNTISAEINRNFYDSLRARGRSNEYIFNLIQPERREQFFKDVNFQIWEPLKTKPTFLQRILNYFT